MSSGSSTPERGLVGICSADADAREVRARFGAGGVAAVDEGVSVEVGDGGDGDDSVCEGGFKVAA